MNNIYVTKPFLPELSDYVDLLESIWDTGVLTHNGPMVRGLEKELSNKLNIDNCCLVTNGTIAIQMAIKALALQGEIITTPFSWVATISAIKWEGCVPVFCDVDRDTFNIDVDKIESLINENTVAIMPVHVFGVPCDVERIEKIAHNHNIKVIYDAAHALGSKYKGKSVLEYGDVSASSLHGTKLFNTAEGGLCVTSNMDYFEKLKRIRFFGHDESRDIVEDGLNGKMTEIHAALGLASIKYFDDLIKDRTLKYNMYLKCLEHLPKVRFQTIKEGHPNYSYFPIVFENEDLLLIVERDLNKQGVYPRRYFNPSLNTCKNIVERSIMPVSEELSRTILCLPLYFELSKENIKKISDTIVKTIYENCSDIR